MAKMTDESLLSLLQTRETDAADFQWGTLAQERRESQKEFYRQPYGNEEDGWATVVTSEVQDTVEWILPDLIDMYLSSPDAVEFEPTEESEAKGAEQATQGVNYVFNKQNNAFLILYTAFKDALMIKNCAVHWRTETIRKRRKFRLEGVSLLEASATMEDDDEILGAEGLPMQPMVDPTTGFAVIGQDMQPVMEEQRFNLLISRPYQRQQVKVEAFHPDSLLVQRDWTSPLLDECPYVSRGMEVTWSELQEMELTKDLVTGAKLEPSDLAASTQPAGAATEDQRDNRRGGMDEAPHTQNEVDNDDPSQTRGWLRIDWVLVDFDGDGVAERREVYRLDDKILSNEECDEVPIATGSPILVPHRWDGMSVAEIMSDLQKIKTDLTRAVVNNATEANNPRKTVLIDGMGAPQADIDDLIDGRPGGIIRVKRADALGMEQTPFIGSQAVGVMSFFDEMGEKRTGVSKMQQGVDPNALRTDRTAYEAGQLNNAAKARIKLIARIMAETVVKPIFRGILRLLTSGDMDPLQFKLGDAFVRLDPNEWSDGYELTTNVGLGTGDVEKQIAGLMKVSQMQVAMLASPLATLGMVTPQKVYNANAKIIKLMGIKNVSDYLGDPGPQAQLPKPPPPQPEPTAVAVAQINAETQKNKTIYEGKRDAQKAAFEHQLKQKAQENEATLQATNDARDFQRAEAAAQRAHELELARLGAQDQINIRDNRTRVITARIAHPEGMPEGIDIDPTTGMPFVLDDPIAPVIDALQQLSAHIAAPKQIIRDASGRAIGVRQGNLEQPIVRDAAGNIQGTMQ